MYGEIFGRKRRTVKTVSPTVLKAHHAAMMDDDDVEELDLPLSGDESAT
jgi:hypothetical protein